MKHIIIAQLQEAVGVADSVAKGVQSYGSNYILIFVAIVELIGLIVAAKIILNSKDQLAKSEREHADKIQSITSNFAQTLDDTKELINDLRDLYLRGGIKP